MRALVRQVLGEQAGALPDDDEADLGLDSLTLVLVVEALEDRLGLRIPPRDVVPAHFASIARLTAYLQARQ